MSSLSESPWSRFSEASSNLYCMYNMRYNVRSLVTIALSFERFDGSLLCILNFELTESKHCSEDVLKPVEAVESIVDVAHKFQQDYQSTRKSKATP